MFVAGIFLGALVGSLVSGTDFNGFQIPEDRFGNAFSPT